MDSVSQIYVSQVDSQFYLTYNIYIMTEKILRFGVAIHVAVMIIYSSWARGGSSAYYYWALPWLALGIVEIMLLMPPGNKDESVIVATRRLIRNIFIDPVTYIGLALIAFLTIQWLNGPCELEYDNTMARWAFEAPPWPSLPFCVNQEESVQVLIWFTAIVVSVIAVRHAMKPSARYFLLKLLVANGALLSVLGFAQILFSPGKMFGCVKIPVDFFATFGYPNHAGTFFVMMTALNMGLIIRALGDPKQKKGISWMTLALFLNAAAIFGSLCRAAIILGSLVIFTGFVYGVIYLWNRISKLKIFAAAILVSAIAVGVAVFAIIPGSPLKKELDSIDFANLSSVYKSDRRELADCAIKIWADHPWTGVGGWGFRRYEALYMPEDRWEFLETHGRANVHNDTLQFLCEHGMIGLGLMIALALTLIIHALIRLPQQEKSVNPKNGKTMSWFQSVSPCVWAVFAAATAMAVHSTLDLPFRSIADSLVWFVILASLPGFIQKKNTAKDVNPSSLDAQDMGQQHHHHHHQ